MDALQQKISTKKHWIKWKHWTSDNGKYAKVVDANDSKIEMNSNTKEYVKKKQINTRNNKKKNIQQKQKIFCLGSTRKLIKINETLLKCPLLRYCRWWNILTRWEIWEMKFLTNEDIAILQNWPGLKK